MKRQLMILFAVMLSLTVSAQSLDLNSIIAENPYRAANNLHSYEFCEIQDTPAPKGYTPFYISHYGRHGSRYEQSSTFAKAALDVFAKADSLGILTKAGKELYSQVQTITDEHKGMEGSLSPRGASEHRRLAERMNSRFPEVFRSKGNVNVRVLSSTSPRSLLSMANFTTSLKTHVPQIDYQFTSADKYMYFMGPNFDYAKLMGKAYSRQAAPEQTGMNLPSAVPFDFSRLSNLIFSDQEKAKALVRSMDSFVRAIYSAGSLCEDLDYLGYDIFRNYFTTEELVYLFQQQNDMIYLFWGNSLEGGDDVRETIKPLLRDIVEKADESIAKGNWAADLRFGHDTGALPLFSLLGMDDANGERHAFNKAHEKWIGGLRIPMATNFQMIFYKNAKGDILVKFMHNEKESLIKGLSPVSGPYYEWGSLREYLVKLYQ